MTPEPVDDALDKLVVNLAVAHTMLIASLVEVRRRREAGADVWRYSLLRTFREYLVAIGIERDLVEPVQALLFEVAETADGDRRGTKRKRPLMELACLTMAAAAVTVLKERKDFDSIGAAVQAVATASEISVKRLNNFRNDISRGNVSPDVASYYRERLDQVRTWSTPEMLTALGDMRGFVN